jgi:glutaredoxin
MGTTTYTRAAKCSDCKFCKDFKDGKRKRHTCTNEESEHHTDIIRLNDLVCDKWKLWGS